MKIKLKNEIISKNKKNNNKKTEIDLKITTKNEFSINTTKNSKNVPKKLQNEKIERKKQKFSFKTIEKQRKFMEEIYKELSLNSLDDFLDISKNSLKKKGGSSLLQKHYNNNYEKLLISIFPNFPFNFSENFSKLNLKSLKKQQLILEIAFYKLNLKNFEDWMNLKKIRFLRIISSISTLYYKYFNSDFLLLFSTIFPNYPWRSLFTSLYINNNLNNNINNIIDNKNLNNNNNNNLNNSNENNNLNNENNNINNIIDNKNLNNNNNNLNNLNNLNNNKIINKEINNNLNNNLNNNINNKIIIENNNDIENDSYYNNKNKYKINSSENTIYEEINYKLNNKINNLNNNNKILEKRKIQFNTIEKRRKFMDELFKILNLNSLDDWLLSKNYLIKIKINNQQGRSLVANYYNNNMKKLLIEIYPFFPWPFAIKFNKNSNFILNNYNIENNNNDNNNLNNINNNINNNLNNNFNYNNVNNNFNNILNEDLKEKIIIKDEEKEEIKLMKRNNKKMHTLLQNNNLNVININNYNNNINNNLNNLINNNLNIKNDFINFKLVKNQQKFLEIIYKKFNFQSLDDWTKIRSKKKLIDHGGELILSNYSNDIKKLLKENYPNFPWNFPSEFRFNRGHFRSIENQRKLMDQIFIDLHFNDLNDWLTINKKKLVDKGGGSFFYYYENIKEILLKIYPNFPWNFENIRLNTHDYFQNIFNQQKFLDRLFIKLKMRTMDDFLFLSKQKIIKNGGQSLLVYHYSNSIRRLLSTVYPNYAWEFDLLKFTKTNLLSISDQRKLMEILYRKFRLNSLDDWLKVQKSKFNRNGGRILITTLYKDDLKLLLRTIYPDHQWNFEEKNILFRPSLEISKTFSFLQSKIKFLLKKYQIRQKKDWYRLTMRTNEISNVYKLLCQFFPTEKWDKKLFLSRTKKFNQRLLFLFIQQIYNKFYLIENFRHSMIESLEFDIFIPALNLAMEYQGEQHYDDIPGGFGLLEIYKDRDSVKDLLSQSLQIQLISIPYWWDQTSDSLRNSIKSQAKFDI